MSNHELPQAVVLTVELVADLVPRIEDAEHALRALAIEYKCEFVRLRDLYLKRQPEQTRYCTRCHTLGSLWDIINGLCWDCMAEEHHAAQEAAERCPNIH